jgi:hypothetical protein
VDTIRRYATSRQKKRAQFGGARAGRIEELRPCRPNEDAAAFPESSKTKSNRSRVHGSAATRPLALPSAGFLADRLSANYLSADHPLTDAMHGFRRRILLLALAGGALIPGAEVARAMVKPTAPSGLSIGDQTFSLEQATLEASLADPYLAQMNSLAHRPLPLLWTLSVKARSRAVGEIVWAPRLTADHLTPPVRRWIDLVGYARNWDTSKPREDDPAGSIYVVTHESITRSSLTFVSRTGAQFQVLWHGTCDLFISATYQETVPFRFSGPVQFAGVRVDASEKDSAQTVRQRLAQRIALDNLRQTALRLSDQRYADGTRMASAQFVPTP